MSNGTNGLAAEIEAELARFNAVSGRDHLQGGEALEALLRDFAAQLRIGLTSVTSAEERQVRSLVETLRRTLDELERVGGQHRGHAPTLVN
jgi:hypothetical protein